MIFALLSLLGLAAGLGGLAWGYFADREERELARLRRAISRNLAAVNRFADAFRELGAAAEQANVAMASLAPRLDPDPR